MYKKIKIYIPRKIPLKNNLISRKNIKMKGERIFVIIY